MLAEPFAQQVQAQPDRSFPVLITLQPEASDADVAALAKPGLEKIEGVDGLYRGTLSGQDILELQHEKAIQSIDSDDLMFNALS